MDNLKNGFKIYFQNKVHIYDIDLKIKTTDFTESCYKIKNEQNET